MIEKVIIDGKLSGLIIRKTTNVESSSFFSPPDLYLQTMIFKHEAGFVEKPHFHKKILRKIDRVEQFLYILEGQIKVQFYDSDKCLRKTRVVNKGDSLLLIRGIHGLEILKSAKAISVKQGPFLGDKEDKIIISTE